MPSGPRWRVVHVSEAGATAPLLTGSSGDTQSVALVRSSGGGEDPGAGVWEPVIEFPQVAALDCAAQTQFASACAPLWPQVALELGVEDSSDSSDATSGSELVSGPRGCALATPALELGPLGLFVLVPIVVRRRSSPKR